MKDLRIDKLVISESAISCHREAFPDTSDAYL
jgi:hypothetical protein